MAGERIKCWAFIICLILGLLWFAQLSKGLISNYEFNTTMNKAMNGNASEQLKLAQFYKIGMFTTKDIGASEYWYQVAAQNGNRSARLKLMQ